MKKRFCLPAALLALVLTAAAQGPISLVPQDLARSSADHRSARPAQFVPPDYPEKAKKDGVEGVVVVFAEIDKSGRPRGVRVESGPQVLAEATVHAVEQWRYAPYRLNGKPAEVTVVVRAAFRAPQPGEADSPPQVTFPAGVIVPGIVIQQVRPVYPPLAKAARIQGRVVFRCVIDTQGNVKGLVLVSGHPILVNAARDAVMQWRYRPYLADGVPVEVQTQVSVAFLLSGEP